MNLKIKAAIAIIFDLDINKNNLYLLILVNSLNSIEFQYKIILNIKLIEKNRLKFNNVLKGLKSYNRNIKINLLLKQIRS